MLWMVTALMSMTMSTAAMAEKQELKLYSTNFQNWDKMSSSSTPTTKKVTTRHSSEELTFTLTEVQVDPAGTNAKFTADFITPGYAMGAKTANTYIETSVLKSVTKVHYVHCATGDNRGWGLEYKTASDADWIKVNEAKCKQAGTSVDVAVDKENVQLRWFNLVPNQNAYMTELAIYGMAEHDGQPEEYTISYYNQYGDRIGEITQKETEKLAFAYGEKDVTVPEGYKFRGWYDSKKIRHTEGEDITGDLRLNAMVTKIETATPGMFWEYDIASASFYYDDHELIELDGDHAKLHLGKQKATIVSVVNGSELYANDEDTETTDVMLANLSKLTVYFVKEFMPVSETGYKIVPAGDAANLMLTLRTMQDNDKIFVPDGVYDLGENVLNPLNKKNVSIIGQSMKGTVIKNAPDFRTESINNTATLYVTGENAYLQDLTLQNALDYYKNNNGRAVALWAKSKKTICKNVRLLSYQDTYYSNCIGGVHYMADCEIHGTVDFICGDGSVYFKNNLLYCEARPSNSDVITASNADASDKGYVFESCRIQSKCASITLGRAWNNAPKTVYLNTVLDKSAGDFALPSTRWTTEAMNALPALYGEYNTKDTEGNVVSPAENNVTFTYKETSKKMNTILSADDAAKYTMEYTLGTWAETAAKDAAQVVLTYKEDGTWNATDATRFLIEEDGKATIVTELPSYKEGIVVRAANGRGGFGKPACLEGTEGMESVQNSEARSQKIIRDGQVIILRDGKEYNVFGVAL